MGTISKPNTFSAGNTIIASEHNDNFDTIYNEFNGNIDDDNVKAGAGIAGSKLDLTDGTTAITASGDITAGSDILPSADDSSDLGSATKQFKDLYVDGTANIDSLVLGSGATITEFSTDGTLADDSDTACPTEKAVKTYIDTQSPASAMCKAWVIFDGTGANPITKAGGYNISGTITKNGTGDYTIAWDTDFSSVNYAVIANAGVGADYICVIVSQATGSVRIGVQDASTNARVDGAIVCVAAFGDQ